ncbi:hypothetical protein K0M31_012999 [Melipona bicolor]|uniref:CHK kinase-like domain-containing protein n=1 Tax=Melipona bicolor TaxID=60889 RepID=A0AA40FJ95_9HYME|nr:hypothetical protein K0M31_012999 [Melipona bicolor]
MCEQTEDCHFWLKPLVTKVSSILGEGFEDVRYEVSVSTGTFVNSNLFLVNIVSNANPVDEANKRVKSVNIVVKKMPAEIMQDAVRSREQFHNEILFYQKCAQYYDRVPRCIYAREEPSLRDSVIVLENVVAKHGYSVCKWKYDTPMEYTLAAFREIARFHAVAYTMKRTREKEFFDCVNAIEEVRLYPESTFRYVFDGTATRPLNFLRKQGYDKEFCDKFQARCANMFEDLVLKFVEVEEPLATLCHGDFTINNILFKKESDEPKVIFIDFALIRYGSPILDLSTFLCLHRARDLDKVMLDNVLRVYHDSLIQCLQENDIDGEDYSYEALYEEYKRKGLFGYFVATYFLGSQMSKEVIQAKDVLGMNPTEWAAFACQLGGEEVDEILANMLLKLKEFGCLDYIL